MEVRELYSEFEWRNLIFSPLWVFKVVASADGKIDKKETKALRLITNSAEKFNNELIRDILLDIKKNEKTIFLDFAEDERDPKRGLKSVILLLEKLPFKIVNEFKKMLIAIGFYIADSSGELYGFRVTEEEVDVLSELAHLFGLTAYDLEQTPSINENLDFLSALEPIVSEPNN